MVFSPIEMVTMYKQAKDKKKQIQIFCQTENRSAEEIIAILKENGVDPRKLPRGERKEKGTKRIAADAIKADEVRSMEDEIIERVDAQREAEDPHRAFNELCENNAGNWKKPAGQNKAADEEKAECEDETGRIIRYVQHLKKAAAKARAEAKRYLEEAEAYEQELRKIADAIEAGA